MSNFCLEHLGRAIAYKTDKMLIDGLYRKIGRVDDISLLKGRLTCIITPGRTETYYIDGVAFAEKLPIESRMSDDNVITASFKYSYL